MIPATASTPWIAAAIVTVLVEQLDQGRETEVKLSVQLLIRPKLIEYCSFDTHANKLSWTYRSCVSQSLQNYIT